ncbi:sulfotransferase, partial [Salmonella enterica]|uniref:sulfotransferase n=1 Tax=Salmonella enterica TaxID=28901 RepID=UPI0032992E62
EQSGHRDPLPPDVAACRWRRQITRARQAGPQLGDYIEIRYEDLVTDTEPTVRRVCEFIDLEFHPQMLRYHERAEERLKE